MNISHPDAIWLILPILVVTFLLWVLWKFWKEEHKQHEKARAAQPHLLVSWADRAGSASTTVIRHVRSPGKTPERQMERTARG